MNNQAYIHEVPTHPELQMGRDVSHKQNPRDLYNHGLKTSIRILTVVLCILTLSKLLHTNCAKVFKGVLIFTLKLLQHVSVQSPSSGSVLFELAKVTFVKTVNQESLILNSVADIH